MDWLLVRDITFVMVGLGSLWWFGDLVVHYTIELAHKYKVSTFFLGFIVLALAADIPELAIAITSALQGASEVSAGDIIGSNFADIAMVIGTTLLIAGNRITVKRNDATKLLQMLFITTLVLILVFMHGNLGRLHGVALIATYIITISWLWKRRDTNDIFHQEVAAIEQEVKQDKSAFLTTPLGVVIKLGVSLFVVMIASCLTVHYAVGVATGFQVSPETIGATIVGMGTSLPELVLSLSALRRKEYSLALGPTLGTVLQQTTLILGVLALCSYKPIVLRDLHWAAAFMFAAFGIIVWGLLRKKPLGRSMGAALLGLFVAYMAYQFLT